MRRVQHPRARLAAVLLTAAAGAASVALGLTGCTAGSTSADDSVPLSSPSPANPTLVAAMLTPKDLPTGWKYFYVDGADGLPPHGCDTGATAAAKVGLIHGSTVLVQDGTLFDTPAHASAYIKREAQGADCARSATASPAPQTDLGLAAVGDESYSVRAQGRTCNEVALVRKSAIVVEVLTACSASTAEVTSYVQAAAKALGT
jgi:hypothetical protein